MQILVAMCQKVLEYESDGEVHQWLRGAQFGEAIVFNTKQLCEVCLAESETQDSALQHRWNLLRLALTSQINAGGYGGFEGRFAQTNAEKQNV